MQALQNDPEIPAFEPDFKNRTRELLEGLRLTAECDNSGLDANACGLATCPRKNKRYVLE